MARQKIKNTFLKGMNQDRSWAKADPQQYREASNVRLLTDDIGSSMGSISTVRGNVFDFAIPDTSEVYSLEEQNGLEASLNGTSHTFDLKINAVTSSISYSAGEIDSFYTQLSDSINSLVDSGVYDAGLIAQSNDSGVILYSSIHSSIFSVVSSNWSVGITAGINAFIKTPVAVNLQVIGQTRLRELAILFTCPKIADGSGQIWKVEWDTKTFLLLH